MTGRFKGWLRRVLLISNLLSALTAALGLAMLPSWIYAYVDKTADRDAFAAAMALCLGVGGFVFLITRRASTHIHVGHREGLLIVGLGWLTAGLVGALPFYLYPIFLDTNLCSASVQIVGSDFCAYTNAAFESISGFTTTGASIITDGLWGEPGLTPDARPGLPRGILLWRAMTQFLGGMGLIVLGVAVLPLLGIGGMQLFKAEVPGPQADKIAPRVGETAKLLWRVYLILSAVCFSLLLLGGMDSFEALTHTFATMSTGGFSTRATSVGAFESGFIEWVIIVFMLLGGTNFALHFFALQRRPQVYWRDPEWRLYMVVVVVATILVMVGLNRGGGLPDEASSLRTSLFQVASIITTTGFASANFETWGAAAIMTLIGLMFVGGMAGSTSGGFKVVRHLVLFKTWTRELFYLVHPGGIRPVRLGAKIVPPEIVRALAAFAAAYFTIMTVGTMLFVLDGLDLTTAFTCSISSLGNIGPGLGQVGPYDHYAVLSTQAKWLSCLLMLLGRLELFTLLVILSPDFWRR